MAFMESNARKIEEGSRPMYPVYPFILHKDEVATMMAKVRAANTRKRLREEEEAERDWWSGEEAAGDWWPNEEI